MSPVPLVRMWLKWDTVVCSLAKHAWTKSDGFNRGFYAQMYCKTRIKCNMTVSALTTKYIPEWCTEVTHLLCGTWSRNRLPAWSSSSGFVLENWWVVACWHNNHQGHRGAHQGYSKSNLIITSLSPEKVYFICQCLFVYHSLCFIHS